LKEVPSLWTDAKEMAYHDPTEEQTEVSCEKGYRNSALTATKEEKE
jgi:hypothetical protein